jgi:phosphoserine aminotransferase
MEHSHRGKLFEKIVAEAEQDCRELAGISDRYRILSPARWGVASIRHGAA